MNAQQHVCQVCGYNMVGVRPERCPFCGATPDRFLTSQECSARHRIETTPVTERVSRLRSTPELGLEHAAYRVETPARAWWIDCPSSLDRTLPRADVITFTHHHFLGASNQYRELFGCGVQIHRLDAGHDLCRGFPFDRRFEADFAEDGLEAIHLGGHTPGFTFYVFERVLFACDYVFVNDGRMRLNPFGPAEATRDGARRLLTRLEGRDLRTVCGYRTVDAYEPWRRQLHELLAEGG
ncbi:MAG: rubredoxin-like domain-containing protein [Deferrisomatales bacterium]